MEATTVTRNGVKNSCAYMKYESGAPLKNGHGDDKTDKATIAVEAAPEGRMRVGAAAWEDARVILKGEVLELRNREADSGRPEDPRARRSRLNRSRFTIPMDPPTPTTSAPQSDASRSERNALQPAALRVTDRCARGAKRWAVSRYASAKYSAPAFLPHFVGDASLPWPHELSFDTRSSGRLDRAPDALWRRRHRGSRSSTSQSK